MIKTLDCPRCKVQPEKEYNYKQITEVRYRCPECGRTAGGSFLGGWVMESVDYCAVDVAAKNWNAAVKNELKKTAKEKGVNNEDTNR